MPRRRRCWSYTAGARGHRVRVYESKPSGVIYAAAWDPTARSGRGAERKRSLGHRNREEAKRYALEQAAKLQRGLDELRAERPTARRVFARYLQRRTPRKRTAQARNDDHRQVEMFARFFGTGKDLERLTLAEWESFADARALGAIDGRGNPVPDKQRRAVRARTVEADLNWLRWLLNWATKERAEDGRYLMRENPARGFSVSTEKNPRRPIATQDRFDKVRDVAGDVTMGVRWDGKRRIRRSYLPELLDIVNGTGRRISPVLALRYEDLQLDRGGPHGSICWPANTDKMGKEWLVPISRSVRAALDRTVRDRPGLGAAYLFASPTDPGKPVRYELASDWLRKAEKFAGVPKHKGGLWHPYRRKWATERKHLPDKDVAAAGGWSDTTSLKVAYQHADFATMLRVVEGGAQLREA